MRTMKVQGKGTVATEPDITVLTFGISARKLDYSECMQDLNTQTDDLRARITEAGIERTELKTTSFDVRLNSHVSEGRHIFSGYEASHGLRIELPVDKDLLNRVLRLVAVGSSGFEIGIAFSVRDKEALRQSVLTEAVRTAKANAATLARASGITLGKLQQIDYGWTEVRFYDNIMTVPGGVDACSAPGADVDIDPEDIRASDIVTLVYEIED